MTIEQLMIARPAIQKVMDLSMDGRTAIKMRRAIRKFEIALIDYDAAIRAWDEKENIDGKQINDLTPQQRKYLSEMLSVEVEVDWEPFFTIDDLGDIQISVSEINGLVIAGLVQDESEEESA